MSISDQCIHTPLNHPDDKGESPQSPEQESETATGHTAEITACMDFLVDQRYQIIKCIGQGAYGVVASGLDTVMNRKVAIKKITGALNHPIDAKRILREVKLMQHFNHENIVSILDIQLPPSIVDFDDLYVITELMETDLHRIIYSQQALTDEHVKYFVYQMLRALKYIHSASVVHRDLKPSNILVNSNCDLKIGDFGLARWYRAPEIMLAAQEYSKAVDVWSVGCIMAEIINKKPLFQGCDYLEQLELITDFLGSPSDEDMHFITNKSAKEFMTQQKGKSRQAFGNVFKGQSPEAIDFLEKLLVFDPVKRFSVDEALVHPYMSALHVEDDEPLCEREFDFSFEETLSKKNDVEEIKQLLYEEILKVHPEADTDEE